MPTLPQHNYEYAIVRIVPQVEREEFLNVGVIVYCKPHRFLQMKYLVDEKRIQTFNPSADIEEIRLHLKAFEDIAGGNEKAGPIALLDIASRFRWLTAKRSTIVQSSGVHPGLCHQPEITLQKLFDDFVKIA